MKFVKFSKFLSCNLSEETDEVECLKMLEYWRHNTSQSFSRIVREHCPNALVFDIGRKWGRVLPRRRPDHNRNSIVLILQLLYQGRCKKEFHTWHIVCQWFFMLLSIEWKLKTWIWPSANNHFAEQNNVIINKLIKVRSNFQEAATRFIPSRWKNTQVTFKISNSNSPILADQRD